MKLKKYVGRDMASILLKVRETLGDDAIIISSRKVGDSIEVLAAKEEDIAAKIGSLSGKVEFVDELKKEKEDGFKFHIPEKDDTSGKLLVEIESIKELIVRKLKADEELEKLKAELKEIKNIVERTASSLLLIPGLGEDNMAIYNRLKEMEVDDGLIRKIYERIAVEDVLSPEAVAFEVISKTIKTSELELKRGVPVIFVGPTGVGKTTTIAKISALAKLFNGIEVAIVSIDVFRVGAMEQMKIYADIVDIPLYVAETPDEFKMLINALNDKVILVDTAGTSPKDEVRIAELKSFVSVIEDYTLIVLVPAFLRLKEAIKVIEKFSLKKPSGIIVTKIDETDIYGLLVNLSLYIDIPIMYVTLGQRIPEDIERADPKKLAYMIIKGKGR